MAKKCYIKSNKNKWNEHEITQAVCCERLCLVLFFFRLFHLVGFGLVCFLFFYFFLLFSILAHSCMNNKEDLEIFFFFFFIIIIISCRNSSCSRSSSSSIIIISNTTNISNTKQNWYFNSYVMSKWGKIFVFFFFFSCETEFRCQCTMGWKLLIKN